MEHLHHFKLTDDPFRNEPDLRLFFESAPHRDALRRLDRGVRQSKGLSVLVGDSGAGKSMVVRRLLDCLEEEMFEAGMIVVMRGTADAQSILSRFGAQLGIEEPAGDRKALLGQIYEQLAIVREDGRHAVLIIDDADTLVDEGALEEICGLLKLEYEERRLLSLVLAGAPLLEQALAKQHDLAHRVDVKVALTRLDGEATQAYLAHRILAVGGNPGMLENEAVAALREFGGGLPGRMNTLADNALFEAFLCGRPQISRKDVERAAGDLGWLARAASNAAPVAASVPRPSLDEIDSELDAAFAVGGKPAARSEDPRLAVTAPSLPEAPPKDDDDDVEDLLVELIDD